MVPLPPPTNKVALESLTCPFHVIGTIYVQATTLLTS
jgi:hypothetical protein